MTNTITITLDEMGGDHAPAMVIEGAALAALRHSNLRFELHGDETQLSALVANHPRLQQISTLCHAEVAIAMDEKPSQALRRGRGKSSMWRAIESVKERRASACVSAGNTGALMAMSRFLLRTLPGIERPAIAAIWPTVRGESIVLDVGATVGAEARQLVEFAMMGEAMARCLFNIQRPTVGLLNIGVEEVKGNEDVKEAARMLRELNLSMEYKGFVEGDDISKGTVDVVVTEGFTGNIALKTAEGTAKQITSFLKMALNSSLVSKIGAWIARGAFRELKDRLDPRKHNGGLFLGLNGVVVKSHGGTDGLGYATAIDVAIEMVRKGLIAKITEEVAELNTHVAAIEPLQVAAE